MEKNSVNKLTREECLTLLREKFGELGRLPVKTDFTESEVMRIKSYFGPWPRALEEAGIKEKTQTDAKVVSKEKRIRAKRRSYESLREQKNGGKI